MSVDILYVMRSTAPRAAFNDLDPVVLTADVVGDEGERIPTGTPGTIVYVHENGAEFEVEFADPQALATVSADALKADHTGE